MPHAASYLPMDESPPWKRMAGGWLFSLILHLVLTVIGGLLFVATAIVPPTEEPAREVGVVLVQSTANDKVEYYSEEDAQQEQATEAANAAAQASSSKGSPDALPQQAPEVALPALPETTAITGAAGLVASPQIGSGGNGSVVILPGQDDAAILAAEAAARARIPPKGPTAELSLFGSGGAVGNSFVFVIDRSKSMGGDGLGAIEEAAKELEKALGALTAEQKFQVVAYNEHTVFLDGRQLLEASEQNRHRLLRFVSDLAAFGPTEHELALASALALQPDVIFLFSDGGDPELSFNQISRLVKLAGGRTAIHSVQFGYGEEPIGGFMKNLASSTRGSYTYVRVK